MSETNAFEYLENQNKLEQEALNLMPWEPSKCTYENGALKQQVFACRDHAKIGICYSCSIICHTSCDLVELFTKRGFTCDCGTEKDTQDAVDEVFCQLRKNRERDIASVSNRYGNNFEGLFCSCEKEYDPESNDVMIQCVMGTECNEDWFHNFCIMNKGSEDVEKVVSNDDSSEYIVDGFPQLDTFDAFICWKCVNGNKSYFEQILRHELSDDIISCKVGRPSDIKSESNLNVKIGQKRDAEELEESKEYSIFLKKGYQDKLKKMSQSLDNDKNKKLKLFLEQKIPFLLSHEKVHEPSDDDNGETSIYDLALKALQNNMQRGDAVDGIAAFKQLKTKLSGFFEEFANTGKVVKEEDIKSFFNETKKT